MADFPNSTFCARFSQPVSSNAPAMSRRSITACTAAAALVGASVPVAAIAGMTARSLHVMAMIPSC